MTFHTFSSLTWCCITLAVLAACSDRSATTDASVDAKRGDTNTGVDVDVAPSVDVTPVMDVRMDDLNPPTDVAIDRVGDTADAGPCASCRRGQRCAYDRCVPALGACMTQDDCPGDSYCDTDRQCVPYGVPAMRVNDTMCRRTVSVERISPTIQCEWVGPPAGDPTSALNWIYSTPVVADLNLDSDARRIEPSVVAVTWNQIDGVRRGMLRVFSGRTCSEQMRIGIPGTADSDEPAANTQIALGDLDGDVRVVGDTVMGHPEIVSMHRAPGLSTMVTPMRILAYRVVDAPGSTPPYRLQRAWTGRRCDLPGEPPFDLAPVLSWGNNGPSMLDITGDSNPEVLVDRYVFSSNGCVLNPTQSLPNYNGFGVITTAADVDGDGEPELTLYDGTYRWDTATSGWVRETYSPTSDPMVNRIGLTAIADFGAYTPPAGTPMGARRPEVVVVSAETSESMSALTSGTGSVRVQTLSGQVVFGPIPVVQLNADWPRGGYGGAPTAADFDGDGLPEIGVAGASSYAVYDPDCLSTGVPAERVGGRCVRPAGEPARNGVLWAQRVRDESSSSTGSSVFDFDGDGRAEVVYRDECYLRVFDGQTGRIVYSSGASSGTGFELPVIADVDGDFATEIIVTRTDSIASTCPLTDPIAPPGMDVPFVNRPGFVILRDPMDRWAASRPVWNQHAYHVTNVLDDGRIPPRAMARRNWEETGLNHFRQQAQGALGSVNLADLTVAVANASDLCAAEGPIMLTARVCNRGTNPVADGALVRFSTADTDGGIGATLCDARTDRLLSVGGCVEVRCSAVITAGAGRRVTVRIDPDSTIADCHPRNNRGTVLIADCPG
jgi:hypothetical protein